MPPIASSVYLVAIALLVLAFAASAIAKLIQGSASQGAVDAGGYLPRLAKSPGFSWGMLAACGVLLLPVPALVHAGIAGAMAAVVVAGQVLRLRDPASDCECFGSLTPSVPWLLVLCAGILAATLFVVAVAFLQPLWHPSVGWPLVGALALAVYSIERRLRYDHLTGGGFASRHVDLSNVKTLPGDIVLGAEGSRVLTLKEAARAGKPLLILAVSPHCEACRRVYAVLEKLAARFAQHLTLIVTSTDDELFREAPTTTSIQRLVATTHLSRFLGLRHRPYALFLKPDLHLQAPPSQGRATVMHLFEVLGNAMSPA